MGDVNARQTWSRWQEPQSLTHPGSTESGPACHPIFPSVGCYLSSKCENAEVFLLQSSQLACCNPDISVHLVKETSSPVLLKFTRPTSRWIFSKADLRFLLGKMLALATFQKFHEKRVQFTKPINVRSCLPTDWSFWCHHASNVVLASLFEPRKEWCHHVIDVLMQQVGFPY